MRPPTLGARAALRGQSSEGTQSAPARRRRGRPAREVPWIGFGFRPNPRQFAKRTPPGPTAPRPERPLSPVYPRGHEGRGIALHNKLHAYRPQDRGLDTVKAELELGLPSDGRDYGVAVHILTDLGVGPLRLLTNNPAQREGLEAYGLTVLERVALHTDPTPENVHHLAAKQRRMGHLLDLERTAGSSTAMPAAVAAPARR